MKKMGKFLAVLLVALQIVSMSGYSVLAAETTAAEEKAPEFEIENYTLVKYNGDGGEVIIPDTVTTIGEEAFMDCESVTAITIPANVKLIKEYAFENTGITELTIPGTVTSVGTGAFYDCAELKTVVIEDGLNELSSLMFAYCEKLETVTLPKSITNLWTNTFYYCTGLLNFKVDPDNHIIKSYKGVLYLDSGVALCVYPAGRKDTTYVIPEGTSSVMSYAFAECEAIENVVLPSTMTTLEPFSFYFCSSIESIELSKGIDDVNLVTFYGCNHLQNVNVVLSNQNYISLNGVLFSRDKTELVYYPQGRFGTYQVPTGTKVIDAYAFALSGITGITLPDTLTAINDYAFASCNGLTEIEFPKSLTKLGEGAFEACPMSGLSESTEEIYKKVDAAGYEAYKAYVEYLDEIAAFNTSMRERWVNPGDYLKVEINRDLQALSDEITKGAANEFEKVRLIYTWVAENIYYDYDSFDDYSEIPDEPDEVYETKRAVCAGYANLTEALIRAQGIPCISVEGYSVGYGDDDCWTDENVGEMNENHVWNEAFADGRWVVLETTWGSTLNYIDGEFYEGYGANPYYFDMSDKGLAATHKILVRDDTDREDIPSVWAQSEIRNAFSNELIPYALQGDYQKEITRQEFCRTIVQLIEAVEGKSIDAYLASKSITVNQATFTDTSDTDILAANALGIVNGYGNKLFQPTGRITRQEAACMLKRAAAVLGITSPNATAQTFTDASAIAAWATESVGFISAMEDGTNEKSVMGGTGGGKFSPSGTYTREQAYLTIIRLFNAITGGKAE